ncbi:hypothetical protein CCP3SC15_2010007 [Gammaproteobacteria bacterium]
MLNRRQVSLTPKSEAVSMKAQSITAANTAGIIASAHKRHRNKSSIPLLSFLSREGFGCYFGCQSGYIMHSRVTHRYRVPCNDCKGFLKPLPSQPLGLECGGEALYLQNSPCYSFDFSCGRAMISVSVTLLALVHVLQVFYAYP